MALDVALDGNGGGGNGGHQPSATAESGGHLRTLLLDAGVGSRWSPRDLEARGSVGYMTWYRLIGEPKGGKFYLCDQGNLPTIARTLIALGADITFEQIQQAYTLDKRHNRSTGYDTLKTSVLQADALIDVIASLPSNDGVKLLQDLASALTHRAQLQLLQGLAAMVAGGDPQEGGEGEQDDDDNGSGLRP